MSAQVDRTAPNRIEIEGRRRLRGADHSVVPDRIEAGTFIVAAGVTHGRITLRGAKFDHLGAFLSVMAEAGVSVTHAADTLEVDATSADLSSLKACDIETQ